MDSILNLIANEANVRLLVTLAFVSCAYMFIRSQMKDMGHSIKSDLAVMSKRIDEVEFSLNKRIDDLKNNDFAHLNGTIEALTYALEKNGSLKHEDKEYVDSRLAH